MQANGPGHAGKLGFRARRILYAVVTEYIATGEPVSSRRIAKRHSLNLSPASIRSVLADLEETGLLQQPHTSAGRVPTDAGFRLFVDALVHMQEVSAGDREAVLQRTLSMRGSKDDLVRESGRVLSALTGAASVVITPNPSDERLSQFRFLPLKPKEVLAVLVTASGEVQNRVVVLDREVTPEEIERVHNYLRDLVAGKSLEELREALEAQLEQDRGHYAVLNQLALDLLDQTLQHDVSTPSILVEGQTLLFDRPEFRSAEKIRAFLRTFEDRELLLKLLEETISSGGVQVRIGAEALMGEVRDVSVISASYSHGGDRHGTVGIIGPARIDYGKVVPLVEFTARMMSEALNETEVD